MANNKENEKAKARELYFNNDYTQSNIARQVGVSERTLSTWINEENWKAIKKTQFHSPQVEAQRLYEELRVISANIAKRAPDQRFPTKEELEARIKIVALINSLHDVKGQWRNIRDDYELQVPGETAPVTMAPLNTPTNQNSTFQ